MKRYWYTLMNESYDDLGVLIPDGSHKQTAINHAKRWMLANGIKSVQLSVNSMLTSNILDIILIEI